MTFGFDSGLGHQANFGNRHLAPGLQAWLKLFAFLTGANIAQRRTTSED